MWPTSSAEQPAVLTGLDGQGARDPQVPRPRFAKADGSHASSPAVHTIELRKQYRRTVALQGISMTVGRGEVFGFLGPNGAGKTTAVKLLLGLVHPSGGQAMVLGAPAGDVETRRKIGYLPELFRFQAWLSAREVLLLHCRLLRLPRQRWTGSVDGALATVGLSERGQDKVGAFSKGMQQRLGLGVALLGDPELVVLDEPTSALDPVGRHQVREVIREFRERGTTVFLNTHLLEEVEQVCDRVAVIDKGRTIATGTLAELVGQQSSVRLQVSGLGEQWWHRFGSVRPLAAWKATGCWSRRSSRRGYPSSSVRSSPWAEKYRRSCRSDKSLEDRFLELLAAP